MSQHFDVEAERNVVFAIGSQSAHTSRIFKEVQEADFFDNVCRRRFKAYHKAYQAGQLSEFAQQHIDKLDIPEKPMPLWDAVKVLQNHAIRRKVEFAMSDVAERCRDYSNDLQGIQTEIKRTLIDAIDERSVKSPSLTKDDLSRVIDGLQNTQTAFYTGIPSVDINAPIQPSDFVIIAARPGVGKSALVTGMIIENFMRSEPRHGIFFCIEMDARQSYARISSQMSRVGLGKYLNSRIDKPTGGDLQAIQNSFAKISENFPERWFVEGSITIEEICDIVEIHRPAWVIIDYVQIINAKGEGWEKYSNISTTLRQLGLRTGTAIIAIAQLKRDADGRAPCMSDIRNSGQFEQDATHIMLLDRPESEPNAKCGRTYTNTKGEEVYLTMDGGTTNRAALLVNKNRNGKTFATVLEFIPETTTFIEE